MVEDQRRVEVPRRRDRARCSRPQTPFVFSVSSVASTMRARVVGAAHLTDRSNRDLITRSNLPRTSTRRSRTRSAARGRSSEAATPALGTGLALVKVNVDRLLAQYVHSGTTWDPVHYWVLADASPALYATLVAVRASIRLGRRPVDSAPPARRRPPRLARRALLRPVREPPPLPARSASRRRPATPAEPTRPPGRLERLLPRGRGRARPRASACDHRADGAAHLLATIVLGAYGWASFSESRSLSGLLSALVYGVSRATLGEAASAWPSRRCGSRAWC